ncbi:uncharacterized protein LOC109906400 isoform X1 [Oncorhynchus kisutch]|uniref:uncharacterized protein LOC109906400 isoform X1 n=1 Tax=Oncorhynchus kisutch TaxID=8019 RepID=UPI0009A01E1F|nr:uncharacterized protein LOC109906400 isoform X1 [Oncorhynchus kisutch]
MDILGSLLIILLGTITGTRADVHPIDKYGLKGGAVCLTVRENPLQEMAMKWMTDSNVIAVKEKVSPRYKERVDYNSTDHSLCLRKLEQTDTGIYIAYNVEIWKETQMVKYNLMVQEAVSIPVMEVVSLSSNYSDGMCDVTVNCSVTGVWVLSVCDGGQCTLSQQSLSHTRVNIIISNDNGTIQCTGKNNFSAETNSQRMEDICKGEKKGRASTLPVGTIMGSVTALVFFVGVLFGVGYIILTRRRQSPKDQQSMQVVITEVDNTVAAIPGRPELPNTPGSEVTSIYVTAGRPGAVPASALEEHHPVDKGYTLPEESTEPPAEALYSTVQQPAVEERHLVDKVGCPKRLRPGPHSPSDADPTSIYSTASYSPAPPSGQMDKYGNNVNKPDKLLY